MDWSGVSTVLYFLFSPPVLFGAFGLFVWKKVVEGDREEQVLLCRRRVVELEHATEVVPIGSDPEHCGKCQWAYHNRGKYYTNGEEG